MQTKVGNVKTLIEKYNEINENISKSISPRGLTSSTSNHSGSFLLTNSNSFYSGNCNNNNNGNHSNHSSSFSISSCTTIISNDGSCLNSNSCLSPSMLSSLENHNSSSSGNHHNQNGNGNSSCFMTDRDDCSSTSSSSGISGLSSVNTNNSGNNKSSWMKISLKINTDLLSNSLCSSTNTSDDEQVCPNNNNGNNENSNQDIDNNSNNSNNFSLSPRPLIKKQETQSPEIVPPPNLDKRRYSRDLIPFTISNI